MLYKVKTYLRGEPKAASRSSAATCKCGQTSHALLASFTIVSIMYIAFWCLVRPHFTDTNDDFVMSSYCYGYSGEYTAHLMYINIIIGVFLKVLMQIMPSVPWYAVAHIVTIYISMVIITYVFLKQYDSVVLLVPLSVVISFFGYEYISALQFSKTAGAAITAGSLLMMWAIESDSSEQRPSIVMGSLLVFLGSLFRFPIFEALLPFMFALILYGISKHSCESVKLSIRPYFKPVILTLIICLAGRVINIASYQYDEGWATCYNNNSIRSDLIDRGFPDYQDNIELYTSLGFTENDLELYSTSAYGDPDHYTINTMKMLKEAKDREHVSLSDIAVRSQRMAKGLLSYKFFPALLLSVLWVLFNSESNNQSLLLLVMNITAFILIQLYFVIVNRFTQSRVDINLIFAIVCYSFYSSQNVESIVNQKQTTLMKETVIFALLIVLSQHSVYQTQRAMYYSDYQNRADNLFQYVSLDKDHFYFYFSSWTNLPDKLFDAFELHEVGYRENISPLGSWRFATPVQQEKMAAYGIRNPYKDIINNPKVYFVCVGDKAHDLVLNHIRDHYASDAYSVLLDCLDSKYYIYRICSDDSGV